MTGSALHAIPLRFGLGAGRPRRRALAGNWAAYAGAGLVAAIALGWTGLRVRPAPLPPVPGPLAERGSVPVPTDVPAPVALYYRATFGDSVPVVDSAIITAHGDINLNGLTFPGRFRFTHLAGRAYRHYIDGSWFGVPLIKVNERFMNGRSRLEIPIGPVDNDPNTNAAAEVGLWMESAWLPSVFVTDPRVHWQPVDDTHALQIVDTATGEERFNVTFDGVTGLIRQVDTMRYRSPKDTAKTPYRGTTLEWRDFDGLRLPVVMTAQWMDTSKPVFKFVVEDIAYNADVSG